MLADKQPITDTIIPGTPICVSQRQAPLYDLYGREPGKARIIDAAKTSSHEVAAAQPLYTHVTFGTGLPAELTVGVHKAVGGKSDFPNPGEILAAAIAACLDSSTRMIANRLKICLEHLEVSVRLGVDVRGTLRMDGNVPVGFQDADISVRMKAAPDVTEAQLDRLAKAAEQSCVLLQTLRNPPQYRLSRQPQSA